MKVTPMLLMLGITLLGMMAVPVMGQTFECQVRCKGPSGTAALPIIRHLFFIWFIYDVSLRIIEHFFIDLHLRFPPNSCSQHLRTTASCDSACVCVRVRACVFLPLYIISFGFSINVALLLVVLLLLLIPPLLLVAWRWCSCWCCLASSIDNF